MWQDYKTSYNQALRDDAFLAWREVGARRKAINIARICRAIPVSSVIEIGCGTGAVLRQLGSMNFGKCYVAADISQEAIEFVKRTCPSLLTGAFVGRADALPFQDKSFSVAILSHVIEHLDKPACAVRDAARVAEYVVVEVPTERVFSNMIRTRVLGRPFASAAAAGHIQFWSSSSIRIFLEKECEIQILSHRRDLLNREVEFQGRHGESVFKAIFKEALRNALPAWVYVRLLTTHATFLCRSH